MNPPKPFTPKIPAPKASTPRAAETRQAATPKAAATKAHATKAATPQAPASKAAHTQTPVSKSPTQKPAKPTAPTGSPLHVFVLSGGDSDEREISLQSGKNIAETLKPAFKVTHLEWSGDFFELSEALAEAKPHCIFNALHGGKGENGSIQGLFEVLAIPYTHSGVMASAMAMDKPTAKARFSEAGLLTPPMTLVTGKEWSEPLSRPYVLKPIDGGSSIGVRIIKQGDKPPPIPKSQEVLMAEKYIQGRELSVGVINGKSIGITEICPAKGEFYDFRQKYMADGARHITPAPIAPELSERAQQIAVTAYLSLECRSAARVDMRLEEKTEQIWVLEVNTQPGMTHNSLMPEMAEVRGLTFLSLLKNILREALGSKFSDTHFA